MGKNDSTKLCRKYLLRAVLGLACLYALLLIPESPAPKPPEVGRKPFAWSQDEVWASLQRDFLQARATDQITRSNRITAVRDECRRLLADISRNPTTIPQDASWSQLETNLFKLAPLVGADPAALPDFGALVNAVRREVKVQSAGWDINSGLARERLYRLLFGSRMAMEEILLQNREAAAGIPAECDTEPSQTASIVFRGVTLHSGDILVSRGYSPTSALISRGNDYPGSFSHVSLLHVDPATGSACVIHSLIEKGVVVTPLKEYGEDRKLRLMALRPRANLPALIADPQVPHKAATLALKAARGRHIAYDFAMDYRDQSKIFCSEVISSAYEQQGMGLWMGMSRISSPTLIAWLGGLGVRHFETQEPADLEYDPQLRVVAEWRDPTALWQAHLDDAVTDVMLAEAEPGRSLPISRWKLPFARLAKACSAVLNRFGRRGIIPEGMSATAALRASKYGADHAANKERLAALAEAFQKANQYSPPYWELIRLAKTAGKDGQNE